MSDDRTSEMVVDGHSLPADEELVLYSDNGGQAADEEGEEVKDPRKYARRYQLELCERALRENVIVYLETGCGKTHIAVLLMYEMGHLIRKPKNNICVFLAPTVALVHQQATVIKDATDFKVGIFCGNDGPSSHRDWEKVLEQFEVLVMTPIMMYRGLCHRFIKMEMISLLVFDECHYAQVESNHPYATIMKEFYNDQVATLPRILGMTASPILGKGGSVDGLEALLQAKVCTNDKGEVEKYVSSPVVKVYYYHSAKGNPPKEINSEKLKVMKQQSMSMLRGRTGDYSSLRRMKKLLLKLHDNMEFCLRTLGVCGVLQASRILLNGDQIERNELINEKDSDGICDEFLHQIVSACRSYCVKAYISGFMLFQTLGSSVSKGITLCISFTDFIVDGAESDLSSMKVLEEPFFSHKVLCLVQILSSFRKRGDMKCIIFVNRIIVARSLCYILQQLEILASWKCGYLVGIHSHLKGMSRTTMNGILDRFRSGELNLLVATKVGEEGLDIQTCCLVVRFDLPETVASFIQSRGRARMLQSEYVLLVNSENEKEVNLMEKFKKEEEDMHLHIVSRNAGEMVANLEVDVYRVGSTGASISLQSSVSLLYQYCSTLPRDEFFDPHPQFFYINDFEGMVCHIILPANAAVHQISSSPRPSMEVAKKDGCLKACQQLHQLGALTDYLLPDRESYKDEISSDMSDSDSEGESSRGELHEMLVPAVLKESWLDLKTPFLCMNSYFIRFTPKPRDRVYKEFGLFLKASLPSEAERMELDLHLAHGRSVKAQLLSSAVVEFDEEQILLAQKFQEMFLKIILDRSEFEADLVTLGSIEGYEMKSSTFYLLLPVIKHDYQDAISVDWGIIKKCLSSPVFSILPRMPAYHNTLDGCLQFADGPACVNDILNSLVYVVHRKSFFFVSEVILEKNAYSSHSNSSSHVDHLLEMHGIQLAYPEQPLLRAKQLFSLRNLLHDRRKANSGSRALEEHFFELPPELCQLKIMGFSKEIGSSISLLPSLMHRLENLLVAVQLKSRLADSFAEGAQVTAERVLEALTTEKCNERISLERLEILGDAFLKFVVGRQLFLEHETVDEGQLTRRRSRIVNNSNLYKIGIRNNLQVYIRDEEFDPDQFFAFGRPCPNICTEESERSIHSLDEGNLSKGQPRRCSKKHHWLYRKTIADVIEALVGAYIIDSGFKAASAFLAWIGINVGFEVSKVHHVGVASVKFMPLSSRLNISSIEENIIKHKFQHKGLLLQAFVHPSFNWNGGGCYQRLEFLGDAALDYLITSYLYSCYPNLTPGDLTDLRSVLVNNTSLAKIAISHEFHKHIVYDSPGLGGAIDKYARHFGMVSSNNTLPEEPKCPKALGDLVESCFGAILLDTGFNLNYVWRKMLYFLNPVMGFSNLHINPVRELIELCQCYNWDLKFLPLRKNRSFIVEAKVETEVDGKPCCWSASATHNSKKAARRMAAQKLFASLKSQGFRAKSKTLEEVLRGTRKGDPVLIGYDENPIYLAPPDDIEFEKLSLEDPFSSSGTPTCVESRRQPDLRFKKFKETINATFPSNGRKLQPAHLTGNKKSTGLKISGGSLQRTAKSRLHEICTANCWMPPVFECCNEKGPSHLKTFTYKVVLDIEEADVIFECQGEPHLKKKIAAEHAAEGALWLLKMEGYISGSD